MTLDDATLAALLGPRNGSLLLFPADTPAPPAAEADPGGAEPLDDAARDRRPAPAQLVLLDGTAAVALRHPACAQAVAAVHARSSLPGPGRAREPARGVRASADNLQRLGGRGGGAGQVLKARADVIASAGPSLHRSLD